MKPSNETEHLLPIKVTCGRCSLIITYTSNNPVGYDLQGWQSKWMGAKSWKIFWKPRWFLWNATFQVRSWAGTPIAFTPPLPLSSALSNTLQRSAIDTNTYTKTHKKIHTKNFTHHRISLINSFFPKMFIVIVRDKISSIFCVSDLINKQQNQNIAENFLWPKRCAASDGPKGCLS